MTTSEFIISADQQGLRLDILLATQADILSRAQAVRLIEAGAVSVNQQPATSKRRILVAGDIVSYQLDAAPPPGLLPEFMPLDIRYEDEHLMVISKPPGLVCHPATGHDSGTLVNALIAYCGYSNLAQLQGEERPGIVHRLDKDTSGLMVVAKSDVAGQQLVDAIRLRELERRYLTLVHSFVAHDTGLIDAPLARGLRDRTRFVVSDEPGARSAVTSFQVLERYAAGRSDDGYCLLECKLFTGRTHQIRVHMAYTHHPVVGDSLYGRNRRGSDELGLDRQFLHSYALRFVHPMTLEELSFIDPLPPDLETALASIKPRSLGMTSEGQRLAAILAGEKTAAREEIHDGEAEG